MHPPTPLTVLRAGINTTLDFSVLWYLAQLPTASAEYNDILARLGVSTNSLRTAINRLESRKMITGMVDRDRTGHPVTWTLTRGAYRVMTDHLKD